VQEPTADSQASYSKYVQIQTLLTRANANVARLF